MVHDLASESLIISVLSYWLCYWVTQGGHGYTPAGSLEGDCHWAILGAGCHKHVFSLLESPGSGMSMWEGLCWGVVAGTVFPCLSWKHLDDPPATGQAIILTQTPTVRPVISPFYGVRTGSPIGSVRCKVYSP